MIAGLEKKTVFRGGCSHGRANTYWHESVVATLTGDQGQQVMTKKTKLKLGSGYMYIVKM